MTFARGVEEEIECSEIFQVNIPIFLIMFPNDGPEDDGSYLSKNPGEGSSLEFMGVRNIFKNFKPDGEGVGRSLS